MTLRLKINLIVGALSLLFVLALIGLQLRDLHDSVREEVVAANRVAAQMLERIVQRDAPQSGPALLSFLQLTGRVRSNDITLLDARAQAVYRSPPSPYKAGRDAPQWFERLIAPAPSTKSIEFDGGRLLVTSNASRAVLDAWDHLALMAGGGLLFLLLVNGLVFWLVGRTARPFARIAAALDRLQAGARDERLPPLRGTEAAAIGVAFNRMADGLQKQIETERRAARAEFELAGNRELTHWIDQQLEQERRLIARELHDELGQSVTAIRSMALSIAQRTRSLDPQAEQAARLIADESSRLYDAMHGMIPRLTPLVLDNFGLGDALRDLAERTRRSQPDVSIELSVDTGDSALSSQAALALYRAAQEGISNALRHGKASAIRLSLGVVDGVISLVLSDNGNGLASDCSPRAGHYGLRWLAERVESLGGELRITAVQPSGVRLEARLPLDSSAPPGESAHDVGSPRETRAVKSEAVHS